MNVVKRSVEIGGKTLSFETGKLAKQASGAVVVQSGDSMVLVTAVVQLSDMKFDFLPLTADYMDRNGASGTIPGGFLKREGRGTERETLISRLIDRPIRPCFPKHFRSEVQLIATVMSYDKDAETDVLALCGASAALHVSEAPITQAVAGVRICRVDGKLLVNPSFADTQKADINLVIAGTRDAIIMVEGGCDEATEDVVLDCFDLAQENIRKIIDCLDELRAAAGVPKIDLGPEPKLDADVVKYLDKHGTDALVKALATPGKHERGDAVKAARDGVIAKLVDGLDDEAAAAKKAIAKEAWEKLTKKVMRKQVISTRTRLDGRAPDAIRAIWCEVGVAPRAHGSAYFTRGETQAFVTLALGTDVDAQRLEMPAAKKTGRGCCPTTSRRSAPARPARSARPSAARSATAPSRAAPSRPCCPSATASPTSCAAPPRSSSRTARRRWPPCAAPPWRCSTPACP
jgi:polyribonucleotide nucleotidyltransferase